MCVLLYLVPPFIDLPYPVKIFLFPFSFSSAPTTSLCCARCGRLPASGSYYWWRLHPLTWDICLVDREDLSLVLRSSHRAMHGARGFTCSRSMIAITYMQHARNFPSYTVSLSSSEHKWVGVHFPSRWMAVRNMGTGTVRLTIFISRDKNLPYYIGVFPKKSGTFPTLMVTGDWCMYS